MRTMPRFIHANPCVPGDDRMIEVPSLPHPEWFRRLNEVAMRTVGRELTADETARAERMGNHNWTLRVVAEALFGEEPVTKHWPIENPR